MPDDIDMRNVFGEDNTELLFKAFEKQPNVKSFGCICSAEQVICTIKLNPEPPFNGETKRYSLLASEYSRLMEEHGHDFSMMINTFAEDTMARLLA